MEMNKGEIQILETLKKTNGVGLLKAVSSNPL